MVPSGQDMLALELLGGGGLELEAQTKLKRGGSAWIGRDHKTEVATQCLGLA